MLKLTLWGLPVLSATGTKSRAPDREQLRSAMQYYLPVPAQAQIAPTASDGDVRVNPHNAHFAGMASRFTQNLRLPAQRTLRVRWIE
jgi:hypothetical protein